MKTMRPAIFHVDAFTDKPFAGNPAGVCILPEPCDELWMQRVAQEMNLPETAFLNKQKDGFNLRWFTPAVEVDLCGHATLASAHVLWEAGYLEPYQQARFYTRSGLLTAEHRGDWIDLDFPAEPEEETIPPPNSEEIVRNLKPNFTLLSEIPARGVIVTSPASTQGYDFVSRFFAPGVGVNEDPVTGSAHCCLGPFWKNRINKSEFVAYQASARGGVVRVRLSGKRVYLGGKAVTVLRGELEC